MVQSNRNVLLYQQRYMGSEINSKQIHKNIFVYFLLAISLLYLISELLDTFTENVLTKEWKQYLMFFHHIEKVTPLIK